jgi:hypothetical protein
MSSRSQTAVNAQIYQLGAAATRHLGDPAADHNGGYARPEPQQGMTTERYSVRSAQVAPIADYE